MRSPVADLEARLVPSRVPLASLAFLAAATALLWTLCLPTLPRYRPEIQQLSDVFRPHWLVLATLLAIPLKHAAAWRCWVGLLAMGIACALTLTITIEAVERIQTAEELDLAGTESAWLFVAGLQSLMFMTATAAGLRQRRFVHRCQRLSRKLATAQTLPQGRSIAQ